MLSDRFIPLLILLTLLLSACSRQPEIHNQRLLVFGTIIDISIVGVDKNTANNAFKIIEDDFKYMHEAWHAWQPGALGRINNLLPTTASFTIAPSMLPATRSASSCNWKTRITKFPAAYAAGSIFSRRPDVQASLRACGRRSTFIKNT